MKRFKIKKMVKRILSMLCAVVITATSPLVRYVDYSYINNVHATGLEIPLTLGAEAVVDYLVAFFASVAAEEAVRNRETIAEAYSAYLDRQAESIPDVNEACLQFYDISKGQTVLVPWSEVTSSLHDYHDQAVDNLTDVYAKYCPQLLGSMKEFVAEVLSGDVYVEGLSETIEEYAPVTERDIGEQENGYYDINVAVTHTNFKCSIHNVATSVTFTADVPMQGRCAVVISSQNSEIFNNVPITSASIYYGYNIRDIRFSKRTYNDCGITVSNGSQHVCGHAVSANVPIFNSYEALVDYLRTGTGYESALNYGTSIDDDITANTDLPPFYKTWQQEQWERIANAPDIGIGAYGYGIGNDDTEWADDIPWVGLDSLRQYADAIPDTYDKVVDNVLSGNYDSNKDIPETYTEAWEDAVGDAWTNVQIADSIGSGGAEEKPDESYYKKGLVEIPDDWVEVEAPEELEIKSQSFIDFLKEQGYNPKNWVKVVEKWASPDGIIYQRNYWTDGNEYFYHGDGIEEFFPH